MKQMSSRRFKLDNLELNGILQARNPHAGLWLDKYYSDKGKETENNKSQFVRKVAGLPVPALYDAYFKRWIESLKNYGAQSRAAKVLGRMIIGLGGASSLETSISLDRTYGVPYIPGSALKGLASSYVYHHLSEAEEWKKDGEAYRVIFGGTDNSGYITFFDALYIPGSGHQNQALYQDIITTHHPGYYQDSTSPRVPADWDSPTPIPFLSATGKYLIALAAPELQHPFQHQWIDTTFTILENALKTMGIGVKTSSGYGRMELEVPPPPVDPDLLKAAGYVRGIEAMPIKDVASQINAYHQKWQQLRPSEARDVVARAIIEKVRLAGRERASSEKKWYIELLAFLNQIGG
jgi:CRISPR-associated protein Cmr6